MGVQQLWPAVARPSAAPGQFNTTTTTTTPPLAVSGNGTAGNLAPPASLQPARASNPAQANVPTTSGAAGLPAEHRDWDARSDSLSERSSGVLSRTGGGRTAKGSSKKDAQLPTKEKDSRPPTKKDANGKDVDDFWKDNINLSFVYKPDADPRDRLLKLLNPGAQRPDKIQMKINHGEREFDSVRCRAIRYLYYNDVDINHGWDQENTWWDEQTAVHFAAQCSRTCLEQLALCWGPEKVGEIAASYTANGHNALHLAAHTNALTPCGAKTSASSASLGGKRIVQSSLLASRTALPTSPSSRNLTHPS
jgi:hypothetical protein